jgi:hypothetical protein
LTKRNYFWVILPATSEDMQEVVKLSTTKHKDLFPPLSEEDILNFYSDVLKHKSISDIVKILNNELSDQAL